MGPPGVVEGRVYVCMYVHAEGEGHAIRYWVVVSMFASSISALPTSDMTAAVICIARAIHLGWSPPHSLALTGPPPSAPSRGWAVVGRPRGPGHGEDGDRPACSICTLALFNIGWKSCPCVSLSVCLSVASGQFRLLYLRKVNPSRVHLTTDLLIDGNGASQVRTVIAMLLPCSAPHGNLMRGRWLSRQNTCWSRANCTWAWTRTYSSRAL